MRTYSYDGVEVLVDDRVDARWFATRTKGPFDDEPWG